MSVFCWKAEVFFAVSFIGSQFKQLFAENSIQYTSAWYFLFGDMDE